jgi:gliding motility-associated-like protein
MFMKNNFVLNLLFVFCSFFASATTYYVNDASTVGDVYCSAIGVNTAGNGKSPATPCEDLSWLLKTSGYPFANGDVILVDAGTYLGRKNATWVNVDMVFNKEMSLIGAGATTIFDEGSNASHWFLKIRANNVLIKDVYVKKYAQDNTYAQAFDITEGAWTGVKLTRVKVDNNGYNTGMYPIEIGSGSDVTFTSGGGTCNKSYELSGGIRVTGAATKVHFLNYLFVGNDRAEAGSSLRVEDGTVDIKNSLFQFNNVHQDKPAACIYQTGGKVDVYDCVIKENTYSQSNNEIGSMIKVTGGNFRITRSIIKDNTNTGGGFSDDYGTIGVTGGTVVIDSCSFSGNKANRARDVYVKGGTVTATNCTFGSTTSQIGSVGGTFNLVKCGTPNKYSTTGLTIDNAASDYTPNPSVPDFTGNCTTVVKICEPPTSGGDQTVTCPATTATMSVTGIKTKEIFYWYTNQTRASKHFDSITNGVWAAKKFWFDTSSTSSPSVVSPTITANTTFYVVSASDACSRTVAINVTYNCPTCNTTISYAPATVCSSNTIMNVSKSNSSNGAATFSVSPVNAGSTAALNTSNGDFDLSKITVAAKYTITMAESVACNPTFDITVSLKPSTPTVGAVTQPTCTTSGTVQVSNHDATATYGFSPSTGISISGAGLITASSGTYKFAASKGGCTSDSVSLTFNAVPGKPTISGADTICVGQTLQLTGSGTTLSWASSINGVATVNGTGLVTGVSSGTTTITYTDNTNCTQTASIQVDPAAVGGVATATSANLCTNTSTTISLVGSTGTIQWQSSPDGSTNWSNISGATSSPYSTPTLTTGTYYYRALLTSGVCATTATSNVVTINVSATPVAGSSKATPDSICAGNNSVLSLTGSTGLIQWQESANGTNGWVNIIGATGATTSNCTTANLNSTMFYKAILSSGACTNVESAVLKVVVNPNVAATVTIDSDQTETAGEITICPDFTVVFTATPSVGLGTVTYQWKNKGVNINLATKSTYSTAGLKNGDIISCEITNSGGKCITGSPATSNTIKVNVLVKDLSLIGNSPTSCNNTDGSINVKGSGTGTVKWALTATPTVFLGTHNGVTLTSNAPFETISNLGKGNYTVTFNNGTCDFTKDVTLTDPSAPQDAILSVSSSLPICQGQSVTITADVADPFTLTGTTKYHWKFNNADYSGAAQPQVGKSITVNVAGTYSVTLVDGACNSNENDTIIDVTATPATPTIANATLTFCKSDNKKVSDLTALITNASKTITWYNLLVGGTAYNSTDVLTTGSYFAEQSEGTCKSNARLQVDVTVVDVTAPTLPGLIIQPSCTLATGTVDVNMPSAGVWDVTATPIVGATTTLTTGNLTINPYTYSFTGLIPGSYTFTVKDINGCASPVSTSAIINAQPTPPATPVLDGSKTYCASSSYTLDQITFSPTPTGTVKYYNTNDIAISAKTVVVSGTTYKFTFDNGTCESTVKLATTIPMDNGPLIAPVDVSGSAIICAIDKPTFNSLLSKSPVVIPSGYSIVISPSPTGVPVLPNTTQIGSLGGVTQTVYYNIINDKGCQNPAFASLKFKINEGPTDLVLKNGIVPFCADKNPTVADLATTKVSGTGTTLKWYVSDVSTTVLPDNTPLANGTYYASLTANPGCESIARKSVIVEFISFGQTTLDADNNYTFCKGIDKKVSDLATKPYASVNIVWMDASKIIQAPSTLLIPGAYYAAETKSGCVSDKPQEIEVKFTSPTITITPKKLPTCAIGNGSFVITGADPTYTYQWSKDGVLLPETTSILSGLSDDKNVKYSVIVTDTKGCEAKDTTSFTDCEPSLPPHIFTPDGNGKNDKFVLNYAGKYPTCKLFIYNRWGALVYESEIPYKDDWDGKPNVGATIGSNVLPASTYFYMIDKGDGTDPESGYVELVK